MNNSMMHYGIKGMRWGVRRTDAQLGHRPKRKRASDMSNEELNREINRLQKERLYKDLTASPYAKAGRKIVQGILIAAAMETSKNFVSGHMKNGLNAAEEALKALTNHA